MTRGCRRRRRRRSCGACDGGGKVMPFSRSTTTTAREATERVMALHLCMPLPVSSFPGWVPAQLLTYHRAAAAGWKSACGHGISMLGPPHIGVYSLLLQPNRLLICTSKQSTGLDLRCVHGEKNGVERSLGDPLPALPGSWSSSTAAQAAAPKRLLLRWPLPSPPPPPHQAASLPNSQALSLYCRPLQTASTMSSDPMVGQDAGAPCRLLSVLCVGSAQAGVQWPCQLSANLQSCLAIPAC